MNPHDDPPAAASYEFTLLDRLARWLIQRAARNSPAALAERLEEEWLADLAAQDRALSRLRFAVGCCWAMWVIAHDYLASGAPASSPATGHAAVIFGQHDLTFFSRRTTILFLIVSLHAVVIYGFATGFAQKVIDAIPRPMQTTILSQPERHELPPPLIDTRLVTSRITIPKLGPTFEFPPDPINDSLVTQPLPRQLPPPPAHTVTRILGGPGQGFPDTDDYYPLAARRMGEMGAATVKVCVNGGGRLASTPIIAQSSGSTRLDEAALRLAKAGSGHYRSTTEDGVPITYCFPFRIRFQLKE